VYIADRANNRVRKIGGGAIIIQPPTLALDSPVVNGASSAGISQWRRAGL
jgi:hypothetical protein